MVVDQPDVVAPLLVRLDDQVGHHILVAVVRRKGGTGLGIEPPQVLDRLLDRLEGETRLLLDGRQTVVLEVVEMVADQRPEHVVTGGFGGQLEQQALAQITGPYARRVEILHEPKRLFGLVHRSPRRRSRG